MTAPHVATLPPPAPVRLSRPRPLTVRQALATGLLFVAGFALLGYLVAIVWPASYEFVAFVQAGSLEKDELVPRQDVLDRVNGLNHASTVADRLGLTPWVVWRRYGVSAEGRVYVVRVRDTDPDRGARLTEVVRDSLVTDLKQRYDGAITPHRSYISALEAQIARAADEAVRASDAPRTGPAGGGTLTDRWQALAAMREELRNAQVFVALSEPVGAVDRVRRRDPDRAGRQLLLTLTGAVLGFAAAAAILVSRAYGARSALGSSGA